MDLKHKTNIIETEKLNFRDLLQFFSKHKETILNDNSMEKSKIIEIIETLYQQKQIILQGPPGTGKTRIAKQIARYITKGETEPIIDDIKENVRLVQFHSSYNYEDFVRGITAKTEKGQISYNVENKILANFSEIARKNKDQAESNEDIEQYILIIDEINRADLSSVLGELIYALEYRDETVEGIYEKDKSNNIILPSNLLIIGTMNTADRSIGHIDYAVRRRFTFIEILSEKKVLDNFPKGKQLYEIVEKIFTPDYVSLEFDINDIMIGHSYFISDKNGEENIDELASKFIYQVLPLLKEYLKDGVFSKIPIISLGSNVINLSKKIEIKTDIVKEFLKK